MTTNEPLPTPPTTAEEGVRIWDAKFASADARARPAFLDFGHALLALRREVGGNDTAFNKKLAGLPLKTNDKNIRADAQKLAFQVEAGLRTREDALALPAREVRALPGLTHGEYGLVLKPKVKRVATPKKPKPEAPNEPNLFDTSAPPVEANDMQPVLGDIAPSAAGDDASQVIDQNEAISTNQPEDPANDASRLAGGDDNAAGEKSPKGPDMEDAPAAIVAPFGDGAEIADNGGKADGVDGAANGLVTPPPSPFLAPVLLTCLPSLTRPLALGPGGSIKPGRSSSLMLNRTLSATGIAQVAVPDRGRWQRLVKR